MTGYDGHEHEAPPLAALFLIRFDTHVGYTIAWKQSIDGVDLDGVEFKSLPSGLHNVKEDLVYFIHEQQYAGVSAFASGPAPESERNANLVAVGCLVPLSHGRLGRSWLHVESLQELAKAALQDAKDNRQLEAYWEKHRKSKSSSDSAVDSSQPSSRVAKARRRGLSDVTGSQAPDLALSDAHPAQSLLRLLDTFGPLVFPLYRAAVLRKRVLIITSPPIREACEFVYDLSILANIPVSSAEDLPKGHAGLVRASGLFSLGVHDIPMLEAQNKSKEKGNGWIACTTDRVLATKHQLYDILVDLPLYGGAASGSDRSFPNMTWSDGRKILATQRDARRYNTFRSALRLLHRYSTHGSGIESDQPEAEEQDGDTSPLLGRSVTELQQTDNRDDDDYDESPAFFGNAQILEPVSWSAVAYSSFIWWASAGEKDANLAEETDKDRELLRDFISIATSGSVPLLSPGSTRTTSEPESISMQEHTQRTIMQTAIIAYFHRMTGTIFGVLYELIDAQGDGQRQDVDDSEHNPLLVNEEDVTRMGLDVWSEADKFFVQELSLLYFGRRAEVHLAGLECCGYRLA